MRQRPFLYFDMGNVLLYFSHERQTKQMAEVAGIPIELARKIVFDAGGLLDPYESGAITSQLFYDQFCSQAGAKPERASLELAASDIFDLNVPMVALAGRLKAGGYRLGVLSNTNECHWNHVTQRFSYLTTMFDVHALSFQLRLLKPDVRIYQQAADLAGVSPRDVFYTDDREENVAAAKVAGFDAVLFQSPARLSEELYKRKIASNY